MARVIFFSKSFYESNFKLFATYSSASSYFPNNNFNHITFIEEIIIVNRKMIKLNFKVYDIIIKEESNNLPDSNFKIAAYQ